MASSVVRVGVGLDANSKGRRLGGGGGGSGGGGQPASVARRNARERNRVKQVNNGFATLRSHIPVAVATALGCGGAGAASPRAQAKKLSKVETLRLAVEYIRSLQLLLQNSQENYATTGIGIGGTGTKASPPPSPPPSPDDGTQAGYHSVVSPEDEELLDVISWWQQQ